MEPATNKLNPNIDTAWINKGQKCWVYDTTANAYVKGKVIQYKPQSFNLANSLVYVELEDSKTMEAKLVHVQRRNQSTTILSNLTDLDIINDAQILFQLRQRFEGKKIFTFIGTNLLIINPYEQMPQVYSIQAMDEYFKKAFNPQNTNTKKAATTSDNEKSLQKMQIFNYRDVKTPYLTTNNIAITENSLSLLLDGATYLRTDERSFERHGQPQQRPGHQHQRGVRCGQDVDQQTLSPVHHSSKPEIRTGPVHQRGVKGKSSQFLINHFLSDSQILNCNPVLEAFGNAKTVKNDNSSRFGKLITLGIDTSDFSIHEAFVKHFFLQKTRIVAQSSGELNFHIFYYLLHGVDPTQALKYHLIDKRTKNVMRVDSFSYLKSSTHNHQQANDKKQLQEIKKAFKTLGIPEDDIFKVVAGVLHLGNVMFDPTTYSQSVSPCEFQDREDLVKACDLLGLDINMLEKAILFFKRKVGNEETFNPEPAAKCEESRDSFAKMIYENLFQYLLKLINTTLNRLHPNSAPVNSLCRLRMLDIYGFQVFQTNGFEQLCVNYTNQRLHQLYIKHIFKQEKAIFVNEGLQKVLANIHFNDNSKIIEMLDTDPRSVFNVLDETCSLNTKEEDFLNKIKKAYGEGVKAHEAFPISNKNMTRRAFIVKHTPGQIEYSIFGFKERNKDTLRDEFAGLLAVSKNPVICEMYVPSSPTKPLSSSKLVIEAKDNRKYMSVKLRSEISKLVQELETNTELHFVRCIKPNEEKLPFSFVSKICLNQIKYLGLLDTVMLRKATYHVRLPYFEFYKAYGLLDWRVYDPSQAEQLSPQDIKEKTVTLFKNHFSTINIDYHFGKTLIFLREGSKPYIDKTYQSKIERYRVQASTLRNYCRAMVAQKESQAKINSYKNTQTISRYVKPFSKLIMQRKTAKLFTQVWLKNRATYFLKKRRKVCITVQAYFMRALDMTRTREYYKSGNVLERYCWTFLLSEKMKKMSEVRKLIKYDMIDTIWERLRKQKIRTLEKYIKSHRTRERNNTLISRAEKRTHDLLKFKYTRQLNYFLKSSALFLKTQKKFRAVLIIQSTYRMLLFWKTYRNLRKNTVRIQRAWRRYHNKLGDSLDFIDNYFKQDEAAKMSTTQYAKKLLFRVPGTGGYVVNTSQLGQKGAVVESVLREMQLVNHARIGLFYYLLDFQPIVNIQSIYPDESWLHNYLQLFREGMAKNNPLQYVQVGECHTFAATTNRLYAWGWNDHKQLGIEDQTIDPSTLNTINLPNGAIVKCISAFSNYSSISFSEPPSTHYFGQLDPELEIKNSSMARTATDQYILHGGVILEMRKTMYQEINLGEKVVQISCGMAHTICKTGNKKIYSWGDNNEGQLGHGDRLARTTPTLIAAFDKKDVIQISAGYTSSVMLLGFHTLMWCGTNATIKQELAPKSVMLESKSNFLWNHQKYTPVRISCSWSRTVSIVGVTFAMHQGSNIQQPRKNKLLELLMTKWSEDQSSILPPYHNSLANVLTEKVMRLPAFKPNIEMQSRRKLKELRTSLAAQLNSVRLVERDRSVEEDTDVF